MVAVHQLCHQAGEFTGPGEESAELPAARQSAGITAVRAQHVATYLPLRVVSCVGTPPTCLMFCLRLSRDADLQCCM